MGNKISHDTAVATTTRRLAAIDKHLIGAPTTIPVEGKLAHPAEFADVLRASLDAHAAVNEARAAYQAALAARDAADARRRTYEEALKPWVLNRFGAGSAEAEQFDYRPRKIGEKSAETKARAAELARATREARGTMGKRQKEKIKGTLPPAEPPHASAPVTSATAFASPPERTISATLAMSP